MTACLSNHKSHCGGARTCQCHAHATCHRSLASTDTHMQPTTQTQPQAETHTYTHPARPSSGTPTRTASCSSGLIDGVVWLGELGWVRLLGMNACGASIIHHGVHMCVGFRSLPVRRPKPLTRSTGRQSLQPHYVGLPRDRRLDRIGTRGGDLAANTPQATGPVRPRCRCCEGARPLIAPRICDRSMHRPHDPRHPIARRSSVLCCSAALVDPTPLMHPAHRPIDSIKHALQTPPIPPQGRPQHATGRSAKQRLQQPAAQHLHRRTRRH